jgi:predicted dehydrogenase
MFGGDVVRRSIEDIERCGIAPYLGRVGLDRAARRLASVEYRLVAIGTRTPETAERLCRSYRERVTGAAPAPYHGEAPWEAIVRETKPEILVVATPDSLHAAPVLHALENGSHVLVEKPLTLDLAEADAILDLARRRNLVVGVDMHKRYDPAHRLIFERLVPEIGTPLYGRAVLEEPLELPTRTFKWAATSNPFSYVGVHWTDLFGHYLALEPRSLHAVGQKELLARWRGEGGEGGAAAGPIDAFDSMQVSVDYASGMRVYYVNNWINPAEFEGAVNQEMEIVGTRGKVEFDQQYRGLRATIAGVGTKTFNPHFTRDVARPGGGAPPAYDGYGKDSIVAIIERITEVLLGMTSREEIRGTYPDVESARVTVGLLQAAAEVARLNLAHLGRGRGAPVTARFSAEGIDILDPLAEGRTSARLYSGSSF